MQGDCKAGQNSTRSPTSPSPSLRSHSDRVLSQSSRRSFFVAPNGLIESCRRLLSLQLDDTVARIVHDNVTVQIGCNVVPVFALVNGGRDRTLFTFRCVYEDCSAFLDIRKFAGADKLKWVIVGISHCHDFSTFPSRMPRNTVTATTISEFNVMVSQGQRAATW